MERRRAACGALGPPMGGSCPIDMRATRGQARRDRDPTRPSVDGKTSSLWRRSAHGSKPKMTVNVEAAEHGTRDILVGVACRDKLRWLVEYD